MGMSVKGGVALLLAYLPQANFFSLDVDLARGREDALNAQTEQRVSNESSPVSSNQIEV